ncbi:hypothetical protein CEXT_561141 [Caerostris extrusa]|uniref:Uncharacterized protein n=1 Tax=Caerostris extrusa TaxID=172846 RepID=A0AAV4T1I1_CAEEX|nr:hypothetical protein CEXT_561141 [Caerostris extrusa]
MLLGSAGSSPNQVMCFGRFPIHSQRLIDNDGASIYSACCNTLWKIFCVCRGDGWASREHSTLDDRPLFAPPERVGRAQHRGNGDNFLKYYVLNSIARPSIHINRNKVVL